MHPCHRMQEVPPAYVPFERTQGVRNKHSYIEVTCHQYIRIRSPLLTEVVLIHQEFMHQVHAALA